VSDECAQRETRQSFDESGQRRSAQSVSTCSEHDASPRRHRSVGPRVLTPPAPQDHRPRGVTAFRSYGRWRASSASHAGDTRSDSPSIANGRSCRALANASVPKLSLEPGAKMSARGNPNAGPVSLLRRAQRFPWRAVVAQGAFQPLWRAVEDACTHAQHFQAQPMPASPAMPAGRSPLHPATFPDRHAVLADHPFRARGAIRAGTGPSLRSRFRAPRGR